MIIFWHGWRAPAQRSRLRLGGGPRTLTVPVALLPAVVLATAAAVVGCAAVPTAGSVLPVGSGQGGVSQPQVYPQPIPVGPGPTWTPEEIVDGFLRASASFADDHAVAREYLDPTEQGSWQPGWAVTVVSAQPKVTAIQQPKELTDGASADSPAGGSLDRVDVTGQPVATLTGTGQYLVSSGPPAETSFTLVRIGGHWRIINPPTQLLLTEADFQRVYQPQNLYFLAPSGALVPDPVFAPEEATNTELATGLVNALLQQPVGWLAGAAATGFPAGSRQIGQVKIIGPNATVNLGGRSAEASRRQLQQIAAQLVWTLASGPTGIHSVELEINGRPEQIMGTQYQLQQMYRSLVPAQPAASTLYFISGNGTVDELSGTGQPGSGQAGRVSAVPGPAGAADAPALSSIAVSPSGHSLAGISADGDTVYVYDLTHDGALRAKWPSPGGACTSVSWDSQGNLWITAGGDLWLMLADSSSASQVTLDNLPDSDNVTDFRVAPDGVRAAMIVSSTSGAQVQLAAISRSGPNAWIGQSVTVGGGITDPEALSWYGTDNVIVLSGDGTQLDEVPLNGGQPTAIPTTGGAVSMTATSPGEDGSSVALGMTGGQVTISADLGPFQPTRAVAARGPVYPG
jgi:hypothetical protein